MIDESKILEKLAQLYNRQEILITQVSRLNQKLNDFGSSHRSMKTGFEFMKKEVFALRRELKDTEWVE